MSLKEHDNSAKATLLSSEQIELPYNPSNKESILVYAQTFIGKTLREGTRVKSIQNPKRNKGSFGSAVEELVFFYTPNSRQKPDFEEVGLELKTTPFKRLSSGKIVSKERLVLSMINYADIIQETFENSTFLQKASDILLFAYMFKPHCNPIDYKIFLVKELTIPKEDLPTIKHDWELIADKVRRGEAHLISGADTLYLEACTKASNSQARTSQPCSDIPAKPRAWAFKSSYITALLQDTLESEHLKRQVGEENLSLSRLIQRRFEPYIGLSEEELVDKLALPIQNNRKPKQLTALIVKKILGVKEDETIAEFLKAGIKPKAIRLKRNGVPKESLPFPAFSYTEVAEEPFEKSDFYNRLQEKYLFVIFKQDEEDSSCYRLAYTMLWQMPEYDMPYAKKCYDLMQQHIRDGRADFSVKASENPVAHVRPHARNKQDTLPTPYGKPEVKKCFWLNAHYVAKQIEKHTP